MKTSRVLKGNLAKAPTGIQGLDEITFGGLPQGRPTLVCGGAGSGKTMFALEFLVRGATQYKEPGVFMAFEETAEDLAKNVASIGFDIENLIKRKLLYIDYVRIEKSEISETGEYDLEGLFIRINHAIKMVGAKRIAFDTIESLFSGLSNSAILRAELRRLFRWLKEKNMTAVITGERGGDLLLTRQGLEEYVSDCVIALDHRVSEQICTRRLRILKYRGSAHGTNEYPFLIDNSGISVLPISSLKLDQPVSRDRVSSGFNALDDMMEGKGFYRGSTVLVSGSAGAGKTSLAAQFVKAACQRGERGLYFAFEESASQVIRNMKSIGVDLGPCVKKGMLRIEASRPSVYGLEMHLIAIHKAVEEFKPRVIVVDPVSNLVSSGNSAEVRSMLTRLIDFLKNRSVTAMFTDLTKGDWKGKATEVEISSLVDTWIFIRNNMMGAERERQLLIFKSRGMDHSRKTKNLIISNKGLDLVADKI